MSSSSGGTGTARNIPVRRFLQALEDDHPAGQVDLPGGQGQCFGNPASHRMQNAAEGTHITRGLGGGHEGAAFILGEIQPPPVGVEQLHAGVTGPPRRCAADTLHRNCVS
jgi:hypothetical protein